METYSDEFELLSKFAILSDFPGWPGFALLHEALVLASIFEAEDNECSDEIFTGVLRKKNRIS